MPRIFDNIDKELLPALRNSLSTAQRADFCVGYMNLRGWRHLAGNFDGWTGGEENQCRLLVGMPIDQERELRTQFSLVPEDELLDQATVVRLKVEMAQKFKKQLESGFPTDEDQAGLRWLASQLRKRKVVVKLHLRYPLHAKLYLTHRQSEDNPRTAYLGSSNLTLAGLKFQGELNVDVLEHDATDKLAKWFEDRWNDKYSLDITDELIDLINDSWITPRDPYLIYIKMAFHLSQEARQGIANFDVPPAFRDILFKYQAEAVRIAARHLEKRGGVLLGDVVGLGKTIMAAAVARVFIDRQNAIPLIICPPNLKDMWKRYSDEYELYAEILSMGSVHHLAGRFSRHRLVIVDESHNLRNRETKTYEHVKKYIEDMRANVILLSATPYNKGYEDISSQLRLFLDEDQNLGIRPEAYLSTLINGEAEFSAKHTVPVSSIRAFEHSPYKEDWQQLLRMYMVRRTRSFIKNHYAEGDETSGRRYLQLADGSRAYFPDRIPHTVEFPLDEKDKTDPYARLYADDVVDLINHLSLPRYGLGNKLVDDALVHANNQEQAIIKDLGRAGKRLMGFCRTNLFKRLESCGEAFLMSVERHIIRNLIFAHAIENGLPIPVGTQDPAMLDTREEDSDEAEVVTHGREATHADRLEARLRKEAAEIYTTYASQFENRFQWMRPVLFKPDLLQELLSDAKELLTILVANPHWDPKLDRKLTRLRALIATDHSDEKLLIFTQFADTAHYLHRNLSAEGVEVATGGSGNVSEIAALFSPTTNDRQPGKNDIRVLIATDVLSEGQNLQDAHIVVNFDLPWALIRLIQRAGRVDRIGQKSNTIDCYTFLPMKGVDKIIKLRGKVRSRIKQNAEVVGSDEAFFDDDGSDVALVDLYNEKAGILDGSEDESEVDLQSRAYQIYTEAIESDPALAKKIEAMPDVVFSAKARESNPTGVVVYVRTPDDTDSLACVDPEGKVITEDQGKILDMSRCEPDTPAARPIGGHHRLVRAGVTHVIQRAKQSGGQLGPKRGAKYRAYTALKRYLDANTGSLLVPMELGRALEMMLKSPLRRSAADAINKRLNQKGTDEDLANLIYDLYQDQRLCVTEDGEATTDPRIICSLSLV